MAFSREDEERRRLAGLYASKTDIELEVLAGDGASLNDLARGVLRAEIRRRGLNITVLEASLLTPAPPRLAVIRVYRDLPDALIAQSVLDSAEIECFLFDENIVRLDWLYSYLVGGVKLRVKEEDAADSIQLLDQPPVESFMVPGVGEYIQPRCPNCESFDVSFESLMNRIVFAYLYFGLPIILRNAGWKCFSCGYEWVEQPEAQPEST